MKSMLIALIDGSIYSESVCHHTGWLAARLQADVKLYHVLGRREAGSQDLSGSIRLGARTTLLDKLTALDAERAKLAQEHGRAILEDAKAIVEGHGVGTVQTRLRQGDIVETVAEKEDGSDLIVIGKRGQGADFARGHLGSNLERIVRASHRPVFVASRAFKPINRLVIAYDGGNSSMRAVDYVASSPLFDGIDVVLATAGPDHGELTEAIENVAEGLRRAGRTVTVRIAQGVPDQVLSDTLVQDEADLLVMGAYGHSRIRSLVIGSTTSEMIRSCQVPVILVR